MMGYNGQTDEHAAPALRCIHRVGPKFPRTLTQSTRQFWYFIPPQVVPPLFFSQEEAARMQGEPAAEGGGFCV